MAIMLEQKNQTEDSFIYEELDEEFSEIEEDLEKKLWELHDKYMSKKNS